MRFATPALPSAPTTEFTFYLDPTEPANSEDPTRIVNPEVINCCILPDDGPGRQDGETQPQRAQQRVVIGVLLFLTIVVADPVMWYFMLGDTSSG